MSSKFQKCRSCAKLRSKFDYSPFNCNECHQHLKETIKDEYYTCLICNEQIEKYNIMGEEDKLAKYEKCYDCMCKEDKCVNCGKSRNNQGKYWRCVDCVPRYSKMKYSKISHTKNANTDYKQNLQVKIVKANLNKILDDPFEE